MADSLRPGLRVFVVEDETLVLFNLEDILTSLGCVIVGPAMRLSEAQTLLTGDFAADVAVLDVNLGGTPVFPVAEVLAARGIPLVLATGYGREGLPREWQHHRVLLKPYTEVDIVAALLALTAPG